MIVIVGDDTLTSNNRTRAGGGSRFFGDFLFLGDFDQQNILGTACFFRTRFPVRVVIKSASLKCTEHVLLCGWLSGDGPDKTIINTCVQK
mgnify:FL=1